MAKPFVGVAFREGTLEWIVPIWLNLISRNLEENRYVLIWTSGTKNLHLNSERFFVKRLRMAYFLRNLVFCFKLTLDY